MNITIEGDKEGGVFEDLVSDIIVGRCMMGDRFFTRTFTNLLSSLLVFMLLLVSSGLGPLVENARAAGAWTSQNSGLTNTVNAVAYGNGLWIAAGMVSEITKSTDGVSWTKQAIVGGSTFNSVVYTGSQWVLVGMSLGGKGIIFTSPDGTTWTSQDSKTTFDLWGVTYGGGKLVAVGDGGTVLTSTDGVTWSKQQLAGSPTLYAVKYAGSMYLATGAGGVLYTSSNGTTWVAQLSGVGVDLNAIAYANGINVVVGNGILITSTDGTAWTTRTLPAGAANSTLYGATYGGGKFIAVGTDDTIVTSPDGITWSSETSGSSGIILTSVASGAGKLIIGGGSGFLQSQAMNTNANLSGLTLSAGTLSPGFAAATTSYSASVSSGTASVLVTPTVADATATVTVNGTDAVSGTPVSVSLSTGANSIPVVVTAQDGSTQKTYTVTVTRATSSSNASLSNLTLSSGTLSPGFAAGTTSYTANVAYGVSSVNVTATVADATATLKVKGVSTGSGNPATVPLSVGANSINVDVTAQDGTPKTYTVTVTRAAPATNASLSNLTISQGTLSPSFASGTTIYTASVGNSVASLNITPTVADATATVKVNGNAATSGNASTVSLNVGSNTITVLVTAQDGSTQQSYTITVTRAASSNADLSSLTLSQGTLSPGFAPGITTYTANVGNSVTSLNITPTVADPTATVKVDGAAATSGSPSAAPLIVGPNTITVLVTAQDGTTKKSYTITVTRAPSSNAELSNLTLSQGTLSPAFAAGEMTYTASVGNSATSVDVTPTVADSTATVKVNGMLTTSGTASPVALNVGPNTITVLVTAQDGSTKLSYTITVTRAPSSNADLSNLTISQGTLSPVFTSGMTTYTASVGNSVTSESITPTVADSTASVKVNGNAATSGNASTVSLNVGPNLITVLVTAQDGTTEQSYTVTVTRAPSSNADLSNLTISQGTLSPGFSSGNTTYTASVENSVTSVNVTPTVADSTATVTVDGAAATSGNPSTAPLIVGPNTITVLVTAQDGTTTQSYTITITRAPSSNAGLSNLILSHGTLSPAFASETTTYTANVGNSVTSVDVTPTVADSTATVTVNGNAVNSGNASTVSLDVGPNTITVLVTAQDGTTTQSYTLTVTRAPSSNAGLSNLILSQGTLSPAFASETTTYTANVGNSVTSVDVTPTVADSTATVTVNGNAVISGNASTVSLDVGPNTITVLVTAQDGTTTQTYTLTVTRAPSSNADLSNLTLSQGTLSPAFASETTTYTASVGNSVTSVDVTPTVADSTAKVKVNNNATTSGNASTLPLIVGQNTITVLVTAQDGTTQKSYTLTVTRASSSNADLSNLTISQGVLAPAFTPDTTNYTTIVRTSVNRLNITPTVADATATVKIDEQTVPNGNPTEVTLKIGNNPFKIQVTAQDGTTKTYTVSITRVVPSGNDENNGSGNGNNGKVKIEVVTGDNSTPVGSSFNDMTQLLGSAVKMSATILSSTGQTLNLPEFSISETGTFQLPGVPAGNYQLVLSVVAPTGEKLAGQVGTLTVASDGSALIKTELIDPYGVIRDSITQQPIDGVKTTLYWADTELNRSKNRTPGTAVALPELPNMEPNQNHNPQISRDGGQYGWMVFPDGDYYMIAEQDGYILYDSRKDLRDEQQGDSSYIRNGLIHVGQTVVQMNYDMQAKVVSSGVHQPYIYGYPDGTFQGDKSITRAELASILARILPTGDANVTNLPFTDLPTSHWATSSIATVYGKNLMVGYPDGTFRPDDIVTRAEMAVVITKLKQLPTGQSSSFTDIIGHWAQAFITQAEKNGYLSGYPDHTYRPDQAISRAETVVVINSLLDRKVQNVAGPQKWSDVSSDFWGYRAIMEASVLHPYDILSNGVEIWKP